MTTMNETRCNCGEWSGEACCWSGPASETVLVEFMPDHLRGSHAAAGNSGLYPHNGACQIRVERSCAERMIETDGEWCEIIDRGSPVEPTIDPDEQCREHGCSRWRCDADHPAPTVGRDDQSQMPAVMPTSSGPRPTSTVARKIYNHIDGSELPGAVSDELAAASLGAGPTGVVLAFLDADGTWRLSPDSDASRRGARRVWVES